MSEPEAGSREGADGSFLCFRWRWGKGARWGWWAALVTLCLLALVSSSRVRAQDAVVGSNLVLSTGFAPDPAVLRGRVEATQRASDRFPGCSGYLDESPQWTVDLGSPFPFLRAFLIDAAGSRLLVQGPGREAPCSGSGGRARDRVEGTFVAGRYHFWVLMAERHAARELEIRITEFPSTGPQGWVQGLTGASLGLRVSAREGANSTTRIGRGFLPDPLWQEGESSGEVAIDVLGRRCQGWVGRRPNHLLELTETMDYFRVQLRGDSPHSLLIRTPDARYWCAPINEEGGASFAQDSWPSGTYRIWVGSLERRRADYRLYYTESSRRGHALPRREGAE